VTRGSGSLFAPSVHETSFLERTIEEIGIDKALIGNTQVLGERFEVSEDAGIKAESDGFVSEFWFHGKSVKKKA
jgi:hypothetical protein